MAFKISEDNALEIHKRKGWVDAACNSSHHCNFFRQFGFVVSDAKRKSRHALPRRCGGKTSENRLRHTSREPKGAVVARPIHFEYESVSIFTRFREFGFDNAVGIFVGDPGGTFADAAFATQSLQLWRRLLD